MSEEKPRLWPTIVGALALIPLGVFLNWRLSKTALAQLMVAIGIEWTNPDQVSDGDKLNFVMSVTIGLIGLAVAVLGYRIGKRQGEIQEEQHRFFEREARRKAVMKVVLPNPTTRSGEKADRYQLYIQNEGDKVGSGFWYLGIPKRMRGRVTVEPSNGGGGRVPGGQLGHLQ